MATQLNPHIREGLALPGVLGTFPDTEGGCSMGSDAWRDYARWRIVERSVQILREHGKRDEEIRSMLLSDFHIGRGCAECAIKARINAKRAESRKETPSAPGRGGRRRRRYPRPFRRRAALYARGIVLSES